MSFLKNASIRTKILSLVIPVCLIGVAGVLLVSKNYKATNDEYSELLAKEAAAEINMAIASQRLVAVVYDGYQALSYDQRDSRTETRCRRLSGEHEAVLRPDD